MNVYWPNNKGGGGGRKKICVICGEEFITRTHNNIACGKISCLEARRKMKRVVQKVQ